jgi:hypothetical protein
VLIELVPKLINYALKRTVLEQALKKTSQKTGFSTKFKEAFPKTEVLEKLQLPLNFYG